MEWAEETCYAAGAPVSLLQDFDQVSRVVNELG